MGLAKAFLSCTLLLFLFAAISAAHEGAPLGVSMNITGECDEYDVTVFAEEMDAGCYDVKIDITTPAGRVGEIFSEKEGWISSFFYITEGLCIEDHGANATFQVRAATSAETLNIRATLRPPSGNSESSEFFTVSHYCPSSPDLDQGIFYVVVLLVILILVAAISLYVKRWK